MFAKFIKQETWFIFICVLSVNFLSFTGCIGYPWTSPFLPKLNGNVDPDKNPLPKPITLLEESWLTSLHSLGALFGLLLTGVLNKKFGKKISLIFFSIPMFVSNLILIVANSINYFYISRFLLGIGTSCIFSIVPSYVAEITEVAHRGKAVMVMPLMSSLSHILVVSVGPYVTIQTFAFLSLIPLVLFYFIFIPFVPDSPYNYVACNKMLEAKKLLQTLRKRQNVQKELEDIINNSNKKDTAESLRDIIKSKAVVKSFTICFGLFFFQQASGTTPVTSYQQEIFHLTETAIPSHISVIIVGVFQLLATILVLVIIDNVGRKKLFLGSYIGLFISLMGLGAYFFAKEKGINVESVYWIPLVCIIMHMVFFRLGAGPVSWTVLAEIFPSNLKGPLCSIITAEMVLISFITSMLYPIMSVFFSISWTFWIFGIITGSAIFFISLVVPEIKGKSFLEIQEMLKT